MWGENFGGGASEGAGGGFVPSNGRSPATGAQSRGKRSQNTFPVAIKQLLACTDENLKIHETEVSLVTIVGLVKTVEDTSTKISYVIDDQTGSIEAITYIGTDGMSARPVPLEEGTYGRVTGSFRTGKGGASSGAKGYILIFNAYPLMDLNELTSHMLEVIRIPIKMKKLTEQQQAKVGPDPGLNSSLPNSMMTITMGAAASASGDTSFGGSSAGPYNGLTSGQSMVLRCISSVKDEIGIHVDQIIANLKNRLTQKEIRTVLDYLCAEGYTYTTCDDEHYKGTGTAAW